MHTTRRNYQALGFTLIEILIAVSLGTVLLTLISAKITTSVNWVKTRTDLKDLRDLNAAVETYKSLYGALPGTGNTDAHHQQVLNLLLSKNLLLNNKLDGRALQSVNNGMNFYFSGYKAARATQPIQNDVCIATWKTKVSTNAVKFQKEP